MSGTNMRTISEMSGLPFYDIKFIIFLLLVTAIFAVLFFGLLKKLVKNREKKELDTFFKSLDALNLTDEEKRIIKIFIVVYTKYDRYSYFLGFGVEDTLSIEDKELIKNFESEGRISPCCSSGFQNFKFQHSDEYKIFKKFYKKSILKNIGGNFMVVGSLILFLMILIFVLFLVVPFVLK